MAAPEFKNREPAMFLIHYTTVICTHQRQQKPSEVNKLLEIEEVVAQRREAVIDDIVLLCHITHGQP